MEVLNKLASRLNLRKDKMTILFIGLNNSGKSTIVNYLKNPTLLPSIIFSTVGFNVEQFQNKDVLLNVIDMSGSARYRSLWDYKFKNCQGVVFVIDSSDRMRLVIVKDELDIFLNHTDLIKKQLPVLFYINIRNCEQSLSNMELASALKLDNFLDKSWHISRCNAISGEGLEEGIQWLVQQIRCNILKDPKYNPYNNSH